MSDYTPSIEDLDAGLQPYQHRIVERALGIREERRHDEDPRHQMRGGHIIADNMVDTTQRCVRCGRSWLRIVIDEWERTGITELGPAGNVRFTAETRITGAQYRMPRPAELTCDGERRGSRNATTEGS